MCTSRATCLSTDWACWTSTMRTSSSSHWQLTCSHHDIVKNCWIGVKQQSLTHSTVVGIVIWTCWLVSWIIWKQTTPKLTWSFATSPITELGIGLGLGCLTPLSTIFQLYCGLSVLWVGESGVPGENHRPVAIHWQTLSHNVVLSTTRHEQDSNSQH